MRGQDAHAAAGRSSTGLLDDAGASGSGGAADRDPRRPASQRPIERRTDDVAVGEADRRCGPSSTKRSNGGASSGSRRGGRQWSSLLVIVMSCLLSSRWSPRKGDAVSGALGVGQDLVARCGHGHAQLLGVAGVVDRELVEHELAAAALQTPQLPRPGRLSVGPCVARRRSCRRRSGRDGRARSRRRPRRGRADRTRRWRSRRGSDRRPDGCP